MKPLVSLIPSAPVCPPSPPGRPLQAASLELQRMDGLPLGLSLWGSEPASLLRLQAQEYLVTFFSSAGRALEGKAWAVV